MREVRFYHLTRTPLEKALPDILNKVLARGLRAVVMTGSAERAEALSHALWTYDRTSFLPHGTARDGAPAEQPVWITPDDENPNRADVLILTDGADSQSGNFDLCCEFSMIGTKPPCSVRDSVGAPTLRRGRRFTIFVSPPMAGRWSPPLSEWPPQQLPRRPVRRRLFVPCLKAFQYPKPVSLGPRQIGLYFRCLTRQVGHDAAIPVVC
jgi:DNA polymerase-3 subunit chi